MIGKDIRLLDCTLRDGGHLNAGVFGESVIRQTVKRLVDSGVDIVEVGFLWGSPTNADTARFSSIADVKAVLPRDKKSTAFSLMADFINLDNLEPCDGTVEIIRLSFKRHRLDWALNTARVVMDKGYKCFINPVNCNVYTDEQYIEVLNKVNELKPYGFSIVDTFGVLRKRDLTRLYGIVESHLDGDIVIGLHLHENLGLAYSLAQHFLEIRRPTRKVVVDASLLGMGRTPGNLCTEQIMDYLQEEYGAAYRSEPALDAIDDFITPLKRKYIWGYDIPYMLSAKYRLHRTYAEYLMGKKRLNMKDIQRILSAVERSEAEMFNEEYIEQLYMDYLGGDVDDSKARRELSRRLDGARSVLLIAPGKSIAIHEDEVRRAKADSDVVIGVNFSPAAFGSDMVFCTNAKRLGLLGDDSDVFVTSNLSKGSELFQEERVLSFNELAFYSERFCDDSTIMLLSLLDGLEYKGIVRVAGFDGFSGDGANFCDEVLEMTHSNIVDNASVEAAIAKLGDSLCIEFVTPSLHDRSK